MRYASPYWAKSPVSGAITASLIVSSPSATAGATTPMLISIASNSAIAFLNIDFMDYAPPDFFTINYKPTLLSNKFFSVRLLIK